MWLLIYKNNSGKNENINRDSTISMLLMVNGGDIERNHKIWSLKCKIKRWCCIHHYFGNECYSTPDILNILKNIIMWNA